MKQQREDQNQIRSQQNELTEGGTQQDPDRKEKKQLKEEPNKFPTEKE